MMIFYQNQVSEDCMKVVQQGATLGLSQDGEGVDSVFLDALPRLVALGVVCLYHEGNIVYMLRRLTAWIGYVDIFVGDGGTIHEAIRVGRKAIQWAAENTVYHKLEARSPWPMLPVVAQRLGWKIEGFRHESFMGPDGEMLDEVEVGIVLRGTTWQRLH